MSERKVVSRRVAAALGIICIILIAGLVGVFAYYMIEVGKWKITYDDYVSAHIFPNIEFNSLNTGYQDYQGTHSHTNIEYDSLDANYQNLQSEHNSYVASHSHSNSEYDSLTSQVNSLRTPKLIKVNFNGVDNRPWLGTPRLSITGVLLNVGSDPAYNCRLHVVLYQSGGAIAKDTYVNQGMINGESWTNVYADIFYEGSALTSWTITPEWTSS